MIKKKSLLFLAYHSEYHPNTTNFQQFFDSTYESLRNCCIHYNIFRPCVNEAHGLNIWTL